MRPGGGATPWLRIAALAAAAGLAVWGFIANRAFYHDDAYITLRYVRNLIEHGSLAWNPGERVEGYTNFLQLILTSALALARVELVAASRLIGIASYVVLALFALLQGVRARPASGERVWIIAPAIVVIASYPLITWALGGLEGPLFTLLAGVAVWLLAVELNASDPRGRALGASGALMGLACLTRPDGLLYVLVSAGFLAAAFRGRGLLPFLALFALIFIPHFVWRFLYYGSLVPNTFHVKGAPLGSAALIMGFRYLALALPRAPLVVAILAAAGLAYWRSFSRGVAYTLLIIVLQVAYVVSIGGDHMPALRLLQPLVPFTAVLLFLVAGGGSPSLRPARDAFLASVALAAACWQPFDKVVSPKQPDPAAFVGGIVGRYIAAAWPAGSTVALNTAGSTPYFAPRFRYIDMLGLNDERIAKRKITKARLWRQFVSGHAKGDGAYVLSRRPDYIILGPAEGRTTREPWFLSDLELAENPRFAQQYAGRQAVIPVAGLPGAASQAATRSGQLTFTYYELRSAVR